MSGNESDEPDSPDINFIPLVHLPLVDAITLEEDEDILLKLNAKLYRFDNEATPSEWKERGRGEIKFLKHKKTDMIRLLMRREKTLKICANHYVLPSMTLKPHAQNAKAWYWVTPADFSEDLPTREMLAIRLASAEDANSFKSQFDDAREKNKIAFAASVTPERKSDSSAVDSAAVNGSGAAGTVAGDADTVATETASEEPQSVQRNAVAASDIPDAVVDALKSVSVCD